MVDPTGENGLLAGHALVAEGAAHYSNGERAIWNSVGGHGRAKCECGSLSDALPSGAARKRWHRGHKAVLTARTAGQAHEHRWGEPVPVVDGPSAWFRTCSEPDCGAWIASSTPGPPRYPDVSGAVVFGSTEQP